MISKDIIRMAREAGFEVNFDIWAVSVDGIHINKHLERFAALIAAAEREQCAKVCDGIRYSGYCPPEDGAAPDYYNSAAAECAVAIRARGESKCPATN